MQCKNCLYQGAIVGFLVAGCSVTANQVLKQYESEIKLTANAYSDDDATVTGRTSYAFPFDYDCFIYKPVKAKKIIIDSGVTKLTLACDGPNRIFSNDFEFDAQPGHNYEAR